VADRATFADRDPRAAARGLYVIRDFTEGPRHGYVVAQGAFATFNLVSVLPRLAAAGVNVKAIAAVSEELFDRQPTAYRDAVLPSAGRADLMFITGGTRRVWPLRNVGAQADQYSLTADWNDRWLTGGLEADVIAEAHLDPESVFHAVKRFADDRPARLGRQREDLASLG
jgi:transketolase